MSIRRAKLARQIPIFRGGGCMKKVKLGEICEVQAGGTPSRNKKEFWVQGNIPWVKIKDINSKYISKVEEHITELGLQFSSAKLFSRGTILYTIFATIGEVAILDIDAATNQAIAGLHLKSEKVLKEYLYFFLLSIKNRVKNDSRGVAQNNINLTYLKNIEVPIVENSIQQEICNNLTKINQIITLRNQQLIELSNLVKSRFNEMFGDPISNSLKLPIKKFEKVVTLQRGFDLPIQNRQVGEINVWGSNGIVATHTESKVTEQGIVTGRSGSIGKVYVTEKEYWPLNTTLFSKELHGNNPIFLKYLLEAFKLERFNNGTGVPTLNRNIVHKEDIIYVPLSLQNEFADFVAQVDKSQLAIQKSLEELETLKKSLMQEYFG